MTWYYARGVVKPTPHGSQLSDQNGKLLVVQEQNPEQQVDVPHWHLLFGRV